jgi:hypothetical protein
VVIRNHPLSKNNDGSGVLRSAEVEVFGEFIGGCAAKVILPPDMFNKNVSGISCSICMTALRPVQ